MSVHFEYTKILIDTYYLLVLRRGTIRNSSRIGMPIGKIDDLLSVYLRVPILFQFIDPRPRTPSGPFIDILLPTQGPVRPVRVWALA